MAIVANDMTSPRSVDLGQGLRLEYVARRKVLRLVGLDRIIEVPMWVLGELGVDEVNPARPFLVFGGRVAEGGSRDFVGAFADEGEARQVFHRLRELHKGDGGWGEVVMVDMRTGLRRLCWFDSQDGKRWWRRG